MASILNRLHSSVATGIMLLAAAGCGTESTPVEGGVERVTIGGRPFDLVLSMIPESRSRGLGGVETVDPDSGMFFVFPDAQPRSFWMYDCLTAIDIAYVDPIGYVTAIHTMPAEPPRGDTESEIAYRERLPGYSSRYPAQFAIELAPGMFESLGIEVGDRLAIPADRLKRLGEAAEPDL